MNTTNDTQCKQNFGGKVIVYSKSHAKKQLKGFAKQYNQMNIVKNCPYNIYIAKGNNIWKDSLTVRALAVKGKCSDTELLFNGIPSYFSKVSIEQAIKKATHTPYVPKSENAAAFSLREYCKNLSDNVCLQFKSLGNFMHKSIGNLE